MDKRVLIVGSVLFAAGVAVGAILASWAGASAHAEIASGDTLVSISQDQVFSLTYTSGRGITAAQRSIPGARFQVQSTFSDGRPVQRCSVTPDMAGHLAGLTALTAKRKLSVEEREREFPVQLGILDVRDSLIGEPAGPVVTFTNRDRTSIAVILEGYAAEVTLPAGELDWLEHVCTAPVAGKRDAERVAKLWP